MIPLLVDGPMAVWVLAPPKKERVIHGSVVPLIWYKHDVERCPTTNGGKTLCPVVVVAIDCVSSRAIRSMAGIIKKYMVRLTCNVVLVVGPPSGSSFSLGRPRAKSLVTSSESSMSTPTTESKNLAEELPPVASKDSDSTGVISNTTKSAHQCDATDASCDPRKHRMSLRPASSLGSSFDWFADGDDDWTDAKYDDLFDELSVARVPPPEDSSEPQYDTLQVWNATEGVWEDVTY